MNEQERHVTPIIIAPVTTKIPRIFNIWGTIVYAGCSITAFACLVAKPWWTPPWYILLPIFAYVAISSGIIALGRIENNENARLFIDALKRQGEENKRRLN